MDIKTEYGLQNCGTAPTPITKDGVQRVTEGSVIDPDKSRSARRSIAVLNYISLDRPDLSVATRVLAQQILKFART